MPSFDASTFLPILMIVIAMIVWWRTAIVIVGAFLIAVLVIGVHEMVDRIDQQPQEFVIGPLIGGDLPEGPLNGTGPR